MTNATPIANATPETPARDSRILDLDIEGMTCASCAQRIERRLNRIPGAAATVNLATERARVELPGDSPDAVALDAVAAAGYRALIRPDRYAPAPAATPAATTSTTTATTLATSGHKAPTSRDRTTAEATTTTTTATALATSGHTAATSRDRTTATARADDTTAPDVTLGSQPLQVAGDPAAEGLRVRLLLSAVLALPVLVLSMVPALQFANWQWLAFALASPVAIWGAWPFHRTAFVQARHRALSMDTLISLGVAAAYGWSVYALFFGGAGMTGMHMTLELVGRQGSQSNDVYLEVASVVTVFLLAGRYLEARARVRSGAALRALLDLGAVEASRLVDGREERVPISALSVGDVFVVRPGEKVATDGIVVDGASAIDASLLTGEAVPIEVAMGDHVTGGTIDVGGHLTVRATRVGSETELARISRLVEDAQTGKADVQRLADRVSGVFVPIVVLLAVGTLAGWLVTGHSASAAVAAAVATIIIACPCALGLATPTALLVGTGKGATRGILIRGPQVIEQAGRIDTVVLDKTGTLTTGVMSVTSVVASAGESTDEVLEFAGALEALSEHPVGRAIAACATSAGVSGARERAQDPAPRRVHGFRSATGLGVEGVIDSHAVQVGRPAWLRDSWGVDVDDAVLLDAVDRAEEAGATAVVVAWDGRARGVVAVADTLRDSSREAVQALVALRLTPVLLTGDNQRAAQAVARSLGIERVVAGVLPGGKLDEIRALQAAGHGVAMVGDGVNDAAALAGADLGIALGHGADAAIEASDITLVRDDLRLVPEAVALARRTLRVIRSNLFWAFAYNVVALPIAMLGLLNPVVSGLAMAASSLLVVGNSLRLRR